MLYPCKELELISSISKGEIGRVKQLVSSGISVNTVLHSQGHYESATVLSIAAYEGQITIMQYLIQRRALINYRDPWLCRNALHWACIGGQEGAVKLLIQQHININSCDRDNVTPVIFAAMFRKDSIVPLLVEHGADVARCDRLHSTALHYASFHGLTGVATLVIKAGGINNSPAIFGQGTPLANLICHKDFDNCRLLIEAGYDPREDLKLIAKDSDMLSRENDDFESLRRYLNEEVMKPKSLKRICRDNVRRGIGGKHLEKKISLLPLPKLIIDYLLLNS